MIEENALIRPRALLLDMDGTITRPLLDFPRIKREMGLGEEPILEALERLDCAARAHAEEVLLRHEREAAERSTLNGGCLELLSWLAAQRIATALITRNSRESVEVVLRKHGLAIDVRISREEPPYKPHPRPLLLACERLNVEPRDAWMVGDGQHDLEAGSRAGTRTVWLSHGRERGYGMQAWKTVRDLCELHALLRGCSPCSL